MEEELLYTMALTRVKGVGPEGARVLISAAGKAKNVFFAPLNELMALPGMGPKTVKSIKAYQDFDSLKKEIDFVKNHKIEALTFASEAYPQRLKDLSDAPAVIFYKGNVSLNHPRIIGIVGTRKATDYGKQMVHDLLNDLKEYNIITVSGLAYGVDIEAHKKSLQNGIPTIGVMAHGLNMVYPSAHTNTARDMVKMGGLMTEHISGTEIRPEFFPRRNRLVAGLIDALVVIETPEKGGSIITAEIAHSYNRDVFAFPGKSTDDKSKGCNMLIKRQKALLIETAADLAWSLGWPSQSTQSNQNERAAQLKGLDKRIYLFLRELPNQKCHLDKMCIDLDLPQTELALLLLNMEFAGYIKTLPGNHYKAI